MFIQNTRLGEEDAKKAKGDYYVFGSLIWKQVLIPILVVQDFPDREETGRIR